MASQFLRLLGCVALTVPHAFSAAPSGVTRKIVRESEGGCSDRAQWGDYVEISHRGYYGDTLIDSNGKGPDAPPLVVKKLGSGRIIHGMELGIVGMCLGSTHSITIPPHLAYDNPNKQFQNKPVPNGATVRYEITLLKIGPRPSILKALTNPLLWFITAVFILLGYALYSFATSNSRAEKYQRPGKLRGGTGKLRQRTRKGKRGKNRQ